MCDAYLGEISGQSHYLLMKLHPIDVDPLHSINLTAKRLDTRVIDLVERDPFDELLILIYIRILSTEVIEVYRYNMQPGGRGYLSIDELKTNLLSF